MTKKELLEKIREIPGVFRVYAEVGPAEVPSKGVRTVKVIVYFYGSEEDEG